MATYTVKGFGKAMTGLMPVNYNPMRPATGRRVEGGHCPAKQPRMATAKACNAKAAFGNGQIRESWSYRPAKHEKQMSDRTFVRLHGVTSDPVRKFK